MYDEAPKLMSNESRCLKFTYKNIEFYIKHYHDFNNHEKTKNTEEICFFNNDKNIKALKENPNAILEIYDWKEKSKDFEEIRECTRIMEICDFYLNPERYFYCIDYFNNHYLIDEYRIKINNLIDGTSTVGNATHPLNPGYVYLIEALNYYKIGKSKTVVSRIKHLSTIMPIETTLIHSFHSLDYSKAEKFLHNKYQHLHHKGEWFSLTDQEVEEIKSIQDDTI